MAKGDPVAHHEDVLRYVGEEDLDGDSVSGVAFDRIDADTDGVSVTRMNVLVPGDVAADLRAIRAVLLSRNFPLDTQSGLARLNVGAIAAVGAKVGIALAVVESPSKHNNSSGRLANPAHAVIDGLPFVGTVVAEYSSDLLRKAVDHVYPAWPAERVETGTGPR